MDIHEFELLPRKLGWKYELFSGEPHITPAECVVCVTMAVEPRAVNAACPMRRVTSEDRPALLNLFHAAFRDSVEYYGWSDKSFWRSAETCLERFFGDQHGAMREVSRLSVEEEPRHGPAEVIGAALVIRNPEAPYLDLLMVHPQWQRRGLAMALVSDAMNALHAAGEQTLQSAYELANEASRAWHSKFGFVEEPDLFLA